MDTDTGIVYTGPAPQTENVQGFKVSVWDNLVPENRCGSCHNETVGQNPMFVRNDDVNMAYDIALTKVDTDQPGASEIVAKVATGHNCWVEDAGVCSTIMTTWIENWVGAAVGGGREIVHESTGVQQGLGVGATPRGQQRRHPGVAAEVGLVANLDIEFRHILVPRFAVTPRWATKHILL